MASGFEHAPITQVISVLTLVLSMLFGNQPESQG